MKGSDNPFPSVLVTETATGSLGTVGAGNQRLAIDPTSHLLYWKDNSGTVKTAMTNPMTTAGDTIYGGASGLPTRLAGGTSGYVLTSNGATSAPSWQAAAGGAGTSVLGALAYSSGAGGAWKTVTSSTLTDIDATNASLAITVPSSGNFLVMIQCLAWITVAHSNCVLGVKTGSTTLARSMVAMSQADTNNGPPAIATSDTNFGAPTWFYITGQTPGAMTIKAAFAVNSGGGTMNVSAYDGAAGHDSPFVMVALAA